MLNYVVLEQKQMFFESSLWGELNKNNPKRIGSLNFYLLLYKKNLVLEKDFFSKSKF